MPASAQLLCFALIALNPKLIAINAQAANDTFAIFFGTLALYCGHVFFERWSWPSLAGMTAAAVLMSLSKANGLILMIAIVMMFVLAAVRPHRLAGAGRGRIMIAAVVFMVVWFSTVPWLGPYARNIREAGSPFVSNHEVAPFPDFWKETRYGRPGATSIVGGVMTFRFIDLLRRPMNTQHPTIYPEHRTSYWSQLYGRSHFVHFEMHPASWRTQNRWIKWLGRVIFILALPPTLIMVAGGVQSMARTAVAVLGRGSAPQGAGDRLLVITTMGFVAAGALYALRQRTFASMNAIYVMPAIPGFALFFMRGYQTLLRFRDGLAWSRRLSLVIGLLLTCYVADIAVLIYQLR